MKKSISNYFAAYWPSLITVPFSGFVACWYYFEKAFFASPFNFFRMYALIMTFIIMISIGCLWFRSIMLGRFVKLEDWAKRVSFSVLGYCGFTAIPFGVYIWIMPLLPPELWIPEKKFYIVFIIAMLSNIFFATAYEGITYFNKWKEAISETERLEKLYLETQFQSLQNQLNPHFLFNGLNVLSSLVRENTRQAEDFVNELSNVYRYLLRSNGQELATVGDELRFIRSFFHLLETRHDTGVSMKIEVSKEVFDKKLPALALQILVENAAKHNEISDQNPLKIEIVDDKSVSESHSTRLPVIIVRNNIQRKITRPHSNGVGLENLRQRYELLGAPGFEVHSDGHYFTVLLPLL
jgi:two-component system, LytTR family, sensor kinase